MGIDVRAAEFLAAVGRAEPFGRTATIGRQEMLLTSRQLGRLDLPARPDRYADGFLEALGATEVVSIDASPYEGADIVADLNVGVPPQHAGTFDTVIDSGTLEHVFNVPVALAALMRLPRAGGRLVFISPTNNESGHGLYQFSPELFFRALTPTRGYEIEAMFLAEPGRRRRRWYEVRDPEAVGARAEFRSTQATYLYVVARRTGDVEPTFDPPPQQSDYVAAWQGSGHHVEGSRSRTVLRKVALRRAVARLVRRVVPVNYLARRRFRALTRHFVASDVTYRSRRAGSP